MSALSNLQRRFYSVPETAQLLGVSAMTVYRSIASKEIPAIRIRNRLIIPATYIDRIVNAAVDRGSVVGIAELGEPAS